MRRNSRVCERRTTSALVIGCILECARIGRTVCGACEIIPECARTARIVCGMCEMVEPRACENRAYSVRGVRGNSRVRAKRTTSARVVGGALERARIERTVCWAFEITPECAITVRIVRGLREGIPECARVAQNSVRGVRKNARVCEQRTNSVRVVGGPSGACENRANSVRDVRGDSSLLENRANSACCLGGPQSVRESRKQCARRAGEF